MKSALLEGILGAKKNMKVEEEKDEVEIDPNDPKWAYKQLAALVRAKRRREA